MATNKKYCFDWNHLNTTDLLKVFVYLFSRENLYREMNMRMRDRGVVFSPLLVEYLRRGINGLASTQTDLILIKQSEGLKTISGSEDIV